MTNADRDAVPCREASDAGFAIILVLWLLVLLSAIAIHLAATGRTEARVAANILAAAEAEALADGGVAQAVYALSDPDQSRRWPADGGRRDINFAEGRVAVTLGDENAKINPNLASDKLMAALFRRLGADDNRAAALASLIAARVRPNPFLRPSDGSGGGASPAPGPAPFESIDEMADLSGMTPELLDAARPHLSIYATAAVPAQSASDPLVAAVVADVQGTTGDGAVTSAGPAAKLTVSIMAAARGRRGGVFVREAVVRLDPASPGGYVTLRWARGQLPLPPAAQRVSFAD